MAINFSDTTPAAPGGGTNVKWQNDLGGNVSAYVTGTQGPEGPSGPVGPAGPTGPAGPAGASGVTAVTGTAPIVSSGGATPAISVTAATSAALGVVQPDNATITVDGSGVIKLLSLTIGVALIGAPTSGQVVALLAAPVNGQFAANFAGSFGSAGANPAATAVYTVKKGATTIGTISISTGGVFTFATTGGLAQAFSANDRITVTAPSPADSTLADVAFALIAART